MRIKTVFLCLLSLLAGLAIGLIINFTLLDARGPVPAPEISDINGEKARSPEAGEEAIAVSVPTPAPDLSGNRVLLLRATSVLDALKARDYACLSTYVHPQKGVTFTPYSTVDTEANLNFLLSGITRAADDPVEYIWGITDGQGSPIQLTMAEYFDLYVFHVDYTQAPVIGVDRIIGSGNSLENVAEAYPNGRFVEFHFPGLVEENKGFDWCSLKLVFEEYNSDYKLVGIIHSQWTI